VPQLSIDFGLGASVLQCGTKFVGPIFGNRLGSNRREGRVRAEQL